MKKVSFQVAVLFIIWLSACKKSQLINPALIGNWNWVYSSTGAQFTTNQNSGIQKSALFKSNGELIITHNDSTSSPLLSGWQPVVLLAGGPEKDTTSFQTSIQKAGCVDIKFPVIITGSGNSYQYSLSNDTLYIGTYECLAPFTSAFVRIN